MESKSKERPKVKSKGRCNCNELRILKVDKWLVKGRLSQSPMCNQFRKGYFDDDQLALEELRTFFENARCLCCGYTLLHLAVNVVSRELVDYCLSRNFDVEATNDNEETTLHLASALNDPWFVEQLLTNKANVNAIDGLGCTPLQICLSSDKPSPIILKKLLDHGAKFSKLFSLDDKNEEESLNRMIKANARNSSGVFPLYEAVYNGDHVAAEKLLADGACPNSLNCYRRTLLQVACYNDSVACVKVLLDAGVHVNESDLEGRTALHYAIIVESEEIVELLLQHGCDLSVRDSDGFTALEMAAFTNRRRVTQQLLEHGAKCTEMLLLEALERRCTDVAISILRRGYFRVHDTEIGRQLMDCAEVTGQRKVVRLLESVGVGLECGRSKEVPARPSEQMSVKRVTFCDFVAWRSTERDDYVSRLHTEKSSARNYKQNRYCRGVEVNSGTTMQTCQEDNIGFAERSSRKRTFSSSRKTTNEVTWLKYNDSESRPNFAKRSLPTAANSAMAPEVQSFFKSVCKTAASPRNNVDSLFQFYCEKQLIYDEIFGETLCKSEISGGMTTNVDMFFKFYKDCVN